ncbi:glutathione S-transferase [Chlorella sorokiniana]|uniref:Glutathione S-transferase n=1 Tax=Chlorella sorokiniana TaxID=3076 RepID=A0A2P6U3I2_CHLSO|nr:glutathione S-transferase [Chlorella sorokiniana]|eukprot:PRW60869.1 glutathione S-transferase [Chlorella sorokiniana]
MRAAQQCSMPQQSSLQLQADDPASAPPDMPLPAPPELRAAAMGAMQQLRRQRQQEGSWSAQDEADFHIASMVLSGSNGMSGTEEGLHLYACGTPNGHKPLIALEELGRPYKLHNIDLAAGEQRKNDFLRINPAGRIPVLVDHDAGDVEGLVLSESGAILFYLAEKDASHRLLPAEAAGKAEALSWVFYQSAHLAPHTGMVVTGLLFGMQHSKEAMQTAVNNIRTAFKNLDARLAKTGMDLQEEYPSLASWLDRALARPAVKKGLNLPTPNPLLAGDQPSQGGGNPVVEAAAGRLAKLGLHLGAAGSA